jgi:hypothetical protein
MLEKPWIGANVVPPPIARPSFQPMRAHPSLWNTFATYGRCQGVSGNGSECPVSHVRNGLRTLNLRA